jgi:hypothetical protein
MSAKERARTVGALIGGLVAGGLAARGLARGARGLRDLLRRRPPPHTSPPPTGTRPPIKSPDKAPLRDQPPPRTKPRPKPVVPGKILDSFLKDLARRRGFPNARVLSGSNNRIAIIGRGMDSSVKPFRTSLNKSLKNLGHKSRVETFRPSKKARIEWDQLRRRYEPGNVPDSVAKNSKMFKENQDWIRSLKDSGHTIIDLNNSTEHGTFYQMERYEVFGH